MINFSSSDKTDSEKIGSFTKLEQSSHKNISFHGLVLSIKQYVITAFMPKDFHDSVTKDYWGFTKWQFFHNVAGSVTGGQLGGVIYAATINNRFDSEPKRYRFQSTVLMQWASLFELLAPLWPGVFLMIASISNIALNSIRKYLPNAYQISFDHFIQLSAQMHKSFALRENLGDITGKSGSQSTAAGLLGTALGVIISASITTYNTSQSIVPIIACFIPFSIFNIYSSYRSNLYVTTNTLNVPRAEMILYDILKQPDERLNISLPNKNIIKDFIPTPKNISSREIFISFYRSSFDVPLVIEPVLHHYTSQEYASNLLTSLTHKGFIHSEEYYIFHAPNRRSGNKQHVALWFSQNAKPKDMIKGFYHACAIRYLLKGHDFFGSDKDYEDFILNIIKNSHEWVEDSFEDFLKVLIKKNWEIEHTFLTDKNNHRLSIKKKIVL
ncbi:34577_t:CDS:2 [Gigaspora margarita]|uniref:34577_t:CDS:1 n=1 Tax=Gigaspora margarita TaxID=4874 RepID=A0ABN7UB59_GIGMA|nr:34577_t:CDS:2 [Gigaspora margarita]